MMSFEEKFPAYGGRGPTDLHLGYGLAIVATLFMILRVYVRLRVNKFGTTALMLSLLAWVCSPCHAFDYRCRLLTLRGQLFTILTQVFGILSVYHGLGNHMAVIDQTDELRNFLLFTWVTVFFFNLAIPTGKVAVAAFLIEMNGQGSMICQDSVLCQILMTYGRPKDPPQSGRRRRCQHPSQHPAAPSGLVPVQSGPRSLGPSRPVLLRTPQKCILHVLCRRYCRSLGLLPCHRPYPHASTPPH